MDCPQNRLTDARDCVIALGAARPSHVAQIFDVSSVEPGDEAMHNKVRPASCILNGWTNVFGGQLARSPYIAISNVLGGALSGKSLQR